MRVIYLPGWLRNVGTLAKIALLLLLVGLAVPRLAALIVGLLPG